MDSREIPSSLNRAINGAIIGLRAAYRALGCEVEDFVLRAKALAALEQVEGDFLRSEIAKGCGLLIAVTEEETEE